MIRSNSPIDQNAAQLLIPRDELGISRSASAASLRESQNLPAKSKTCTCSLTAAPASESPTFYRRQLPNYLISFVSPEGRALFSEALGAGHVENYFTLVGNFTTQTDPAFCGLGSLAMVLNALEIDPGRAWKGVWRWYSDEMLECCKPLDLVKTHGITFEQFVCLAECHGLEVTPRRYDQLTLAQFEMDLEETSSKPGTHMVVSFSRQKMGQTGVGHFSPIGAYHKGRKHALVLDVARFKYPCYWAPIDLLFEAMEPVDPDTGLPRGYIMLSSKDSVPRVAIDT